MTTTIRLVIVATAAVLMTLTGAAWAADVPFVTGGVGADERADLQAKEKDYNLKIVAAETSGAYVADVAVVIESAAKGPVLETTTDGPILLAKLAPAAPRSDPEGLRHRGRVERGPWGAPSSTSAGSWPH